MKDKKARFNLAFFILLIYSPNCCSLIGATNSFPSLHTVNLTISPTLYLLISFLSSSTVSIFLAFHSNNYIIGNSPLYLQHYHGHLSYSYPFRISVSFNHLISNLCYQNPIPDAQSYPFELPHHRHKHIEGIAKPRPSALDLRVFIPIISSCLPVYHHYYLDLCCISLDHSKLIVAIGDYSLH